MIALFGFLTTRAWNLKHAILKWSSVIVDLPAAVSLIK
jgi:hypothetical protein